MGIFSRRKKTTINDDFYDADTVFEKHYTSFAESVRAETNIGSQDCKQIHYTLQDGTVYAIRTVAESLVFASPAEHADLTWAVDTSNRVSHVEMPVLGALKSADRLVHDFAMHDDGSLSAQRTAELLSSFTFDTMQFLHDNYEYVKSVRSSFLMTDAEIAETQHLKRVGEMPIDRIADALHATDVAEDEILHRLGFEEEDGLLGVIEVLEQDMSTLPDDANAIDIVVRGILTGDETVTLSALHDRTLGLLWRDVLDAVERLYIEDMIELTGGTVHRELPDLEGAPQVLTDLDTDFIMGEVVEPDPYAIERDMTEDVKALEGVIVDSAFADLSDDDDGDFTYEEIFDTADQGFTTGALDDTLLTQDTKTVLSASEVSPRLAERTIRFLSENDRLERELLALEDTVVKTRGELREHTTVFEDIALQRELYGIEDSGKQYIQETKDTVNATYFKLAEKEEQRHKLNSARREVLTEVHSIVEKLTSTGVQDILNRIEQKIEAIDNSQNVAFQSEREEAEALAAETVAPDSSIGTPLFDRLMEEYSLKL